MTRKIQIITPYSYGTENLRLESYRRFDGKDDSVDSFVWDRDGKSIYYTLNDYESKNDKALSKRSHMQARASPWSSMAFGMC